MYGSHCCKHIDVSDIQYDKKHNLLFYLHLHIHIAKVRKGVPFKKPYIKFGASFANKIKSPVLVSSAKTSCIFDLSFKT